MSTTVHGPGAAPVETLEVDLDEPETPLTTAFDVQGHREQAAAMFDANAYQNAKPNVDGEDADSATVKIAGSFKIDLKNADDVAWFNRLQRGQSVDLQCELEVVDRHAPYKRNADDQETVAAVAKLKLVHAHRLAPEQL